MNFDFESLFGVYLLFSHTNYLISAISTIYIPYIFYFPYFQVTTKKQDGYILALEHYLNILTPATGKEMCYCREIKKLDFLPKSTTAQL